MSKKVWIITLCLTALFLFVRLPGLDLPYHQDEWKNVETASNIEDAGKFYAHPPLFQMIFVAAHEIFGADYFRVLPLLFAAASAILLYFVVRNRADKTAGFLAVGIYSICSYGILGSLVPDVDGAILPFFFLLAVLFYDKWKSSSGSKKKLWLAATLAILTVGFLVKLNFILVIGALVLDYLWDERKNLSVKKILGLGALTLFFGLLYTGILYLIGYVYPAFDLSIMFGHAGQFSEDIARNWIQIAVQGSKAIFYLSPLLVVPVLFISREIADKFKVFILYLVIGGIFYFIVFDFSRGALDKYLMYAVIPLAAIVGGIFARLFKSHNDLSKWRAPLLVGIGLSALLYWLNFLPHEVLPLYPKILWFTRVLHGEWAILNPFHGGSGPLGFYISFLFIGMSFIFTIVLGLVGLLKKEWRGGIALVILITGLTYNAVFAEELLVGKINGSSQKVLEEAIDYIGKNNLITKVLTYNDTGAGLLQRQNKYSGRIYATPDSEEGYKKLFAKHQALGGHFLVVGIPPLGPSSFYGKFFAECDSLFATTSGKITANVYECKSK